MTTHPFPPKAITHLKRSDKRLAQIIKQVGSLKIRPRPGFAVLSNSIISQQLSIAAADSIIARVKQATSCWPLTPKALASTTDKQLRACGLAQRKVEYLRTLQAAVDSGGLSFQRLAKLPDDAVMDTLTALRGIGPWTAEMFLIFGLHRPDVLSTRDAGLAASIRAAYDLPADCDETTLIAVAEPWRPYRSIASRYLWAWRDRE